MRVVGFDGWRRGWVGVRLEDGTFHEAVVGQALAGLITPTDEAVGVDMPLGFADGATPRPFDVQARARLGRRAATLFIVPSREVMQADTYAEANRISNREYGKGISKQVYNLRTKIFEATGLEDDRIIEIHPEIVFSELAGEPLPEPKKTWAGQQRRLSLLAEAGVTLPAEAGTAGIVPPDDLIDAAAVALATWKTIDTRVP